mmetsp:Transcript_7527/g.19057  ORF Transcript_7527/g.19057 Transcript_7527/m.19057 type:complete len:103 (+) Transcript_7527:79-387(+)
MASIRRSLMLMIASVVSASAGYFSPDSCTEMFATMKQLGGPVPPGEGVDGCEEVCGKMLEIIQYWKPGHEMAKYACEQAAPYGCVFKGVDGVHPKTLAEVGC